MKTLEHKIPPPLVGALCGALAWALAAAAPEWRLDGGWRLPLAVLCLAAGAALDMWALLLFKRQRTTPSPLAPGRSRTVVQSGPYRFTRNPMYVGMALLLGALCLWLGNPVSLLALVVFVAFITRFQIQPEERALRAKFGTPYEDYCRQVRRWL
ncbi:methyltransferase family protein [Pulveribacter suum]|uniref:Protein-S-isoprenylcysteine methyltransferase n=1 Tax=Pulveribacter suum TaxID=2116657 RepID=A0A2P1NKT1_9BURK|nr:isoprenylcysteine carboxylmethyltransferase family protein [Pulveribacter suum]AVP57674.1 protein-S-isoprenylcysteine methyltransferase [Pulveribacter suum]